MKPPQPQTPPKTISILTLFPTSGQECKIITIQTINFRYYPKLDGAFPIIARPNNKSYNKERTLQDQAIALILDFGSWIEGFRTFARSLLLNVRALLGIRCKLDIKIQTLISAQSQRHWA
jgi:hypothetical protein